MSECDYPRVCDEAGCSGKCKTNPSTDEWLDKPDGDGLFWMRDAVGDVEIVKVYRNTAWDAFAYEKEYESLDCGYFDGCKWQRVKPHSPVPNPLPKSKTVELTVRVRKHTDRWLSDWTVDGRVVAFRSHDTKAQAITATRLEGIEPEVQE